MRPQAMNPATRGEALESLSNTSPADPLDLLIVGGGVVGTAAAFDAATRGLKTALVEARDIAEGTSSRSSKLVHGGLRYLQMLDFKLVAEALRERNLLLSYTAPHLVRELPFIFPFKKRVADRAFIGTGVTLYDTLSLVSAGLNKRKTHHAYKVPTHRHLGRKSLKSRFAGLDPEKFVGALEYFDAQVDDARLVMTLARSAHSLGAEVATQTKVIDYLRKEPAANADASVVGAVVEDQETGRRLKVYAKQTLIATGVWTEEQEELAHSTSPLKVVASKGAHITVPKERIAANGHVGVITQTASSVLFIIPMPTYWIIGTTDTPWSEPVDAPAPTARDIRYILECANDVLGSELTQEDVISSWAGLRPLLKSAAAEAEEASSKVSREHAVTRLAPGLSAVAGGKLTTYRSMAEDAVDFALSPAQGRRRSLTREIPLLGGQGYQEWAGQSEALMDQYGFSPEAIDRLLNRYGSLLREVLSLIDQRPDLAEPVTYGGGYLRVEYVYAAKYEGALHIADFMERRTRLVHEVPDRGIKALDEVTELVAGELGWDEETRRNEQERYTRYVQAHLQAELSGSDAEAADAIRQTFHKVGSPDRGA